jgi:hypothetical protein
MSYGNNPREEKICLADSDATSIYNIDKRLNTSILFKRVREVS